MLEGYPTLATRQTPNPPNNTVTPTSTAAAIPGGNQLNSLCSIEASATWFR